MASLKVSALAGAAAAGLPIGVAGCAPGHHSAAGQAAAGPGLTGAIPGRAERHPAGSPLTRSARRSRALGLAATSCLIKPAGREGGVGCPIGGEREKGKE
jgi:hypothetical protein